MRILRFAPLLLLAGCVSVPSLPPATPDQPPFPVFAFFAGASHGEGRIHVLFHAPHGTHVDSAGEIEPDGTLRLVQRIREDGKPPRSRTWTMRRTAPGRYTGTLTDADGPVTAQAGPGTLAIRYPMKGGLQVEQTLRLDPGGRSAHNVLTVHKFGLTVAALSETIVKGG